MAFLKDLISKYREILIYLVFGVLTTMINYLVYLPCYNLLSLSGSLSNVIAWAVAVIFAYLTNKPFVFQSHDWSLDVVIPEFAKFVGGRVASGGLETMIIWLLVDQMNFNGNLIKILTSVFVVILNYVFSKLLVFKK